MLVGAVGNMGIQHEDLLRPYVDFVSSSERWNVEKPAPEFFERVIAEARRPAAEVAYVGDRVDNDIMPALAAGMVAVHIRRGPWGYLHEPPDEAITDPLARRAAGGSAVTEYRVGTGFDAHALEDGVPLVLGGVRIEHPRGLAGHSDGDVLAHALTDAVLGAAGLEDIGALFPSGDPALEGADSLELLREAWRRVREAGWELANADVVLIGEEPRLAPHRDAMRAKLAGALGVDAGACRGARDDDGQARLHRPRRRACRAGRCAAAAMKLRIYTHAERDLSGRLPDLWPEFMGHDQVISTFWPRLYDVYPDFQLWIVDDKETIGYACTLPVRWDGIPEQRGLDWAMSNGVAGDPTTLCAVVAGSCRRIAARASRRRSCGAWRVSRRRTVSTV